MVLIIVILQGVFYVVDFLLLCNETISVRYLFCIKKF